MPARRSLLAPSLLLPGRVAPRTVFRFALAGALVLSLIAAVASAASLPAGDQGAPPPAAQAAAGHSLTPADLHAIYRLPRTGAAHQKIAIVSAYDDPRIQSDLTAYSHRFGLPACTRANHCFTELNQNGSAAPLPQADPTGSFLIESSVGAEVARGVCQSCSILLVEANSLTKEDLSRAVHTAAKAGATVIVTAFNIGTAPDDTRYTSDYVNRGAVVVAASGDEGYSGEPTFPSSLPGVLAVGGTSLKLSSSGHYAGESAWNDTSSGCAMWDTPASWQASLASAVGCGKHRAVADLASVAAPGALVHIAGAGSQCKTGWCEAQGTSISAPIIAGVIGLAGSAGSSEMPMLYRHARLEHGVLRDVTHGAATGCQGQRICQAGPGFDGPTGLGTPYGLGAFLPSGGAIGNRRVNVAVATNGGRLAARGGRLPVTVRNGNAFSVTGTITVTYRPRGARRAATLAVAKLSLPPLGSQRLQPAIASASARTLKRLRTLRGSVRLVIKGPAGAAVTVVRSVVLQAR